MAVVAHVQAGWAALLSGFERRAGFSGAFCLSWQRGARGVLEEQRGQVPGSWGWMEEVAVPAQIQWLQQG